MKIRKSEVFKSSSMYPACWEECLKSARSQGFKYIDFNGMIFDTSKDQSPEFKNSICIREDLTDEDTKGIDEKLYDFFKIINDSRPEQLQFSDYRLGEMVRDICDLFAF